MPRNMITGEVVSIDEVLQIMSSHVTSGKKLIFRMTNSKEIGEIFYYYKIPMIIVAISSKEECIANALWGDREKLIEVLNISAYKYFYEVEPAD